MKPAVAGAGTGADADPERPGLGRAAAVVSGWNLVSRLTGFARVLAMGAALGATSLGDTYQAANLVSNVLFELLAGGMLSAVLVPAFVTLIGAGDRAGARRLAGRLIGVGAVVLGAVVAIGMVAAPMIMQALTAAVDNEAVRDRQVEIGAFLLLFFLPQVLLYAAGAVATAVLHADRRFAAAAAAPVANNVIVIATMVAFRALRDGATDLDPSTGQLLVLALGTTGGVLAMTAVPWLALRSTGDSIRPAWPGSDDRAEVGGLARSGLWAAGHLGASQVLIAVTVVVAGGVTGGVVAYQIAFTFFLLPHAVLANPVYTVLYPRLASDAAEGRLRAFAADLGAGLRTLAFVLLPAAAVLAAVAEPLLRLLSIGALGTSDASLVAAALAAYAAGLLGYSSGFLLTRASYALGDARTPTILYAGLCAAGIVVMVVVGGALDGRSKLVALGLVHAAVVTAAAVALAAHVVKRSHERLPATGIVPAALSALAAGGAAWVVVGAVDTGSRAGAALACILAGVAATIAFLAVAVPTRSLATVLELLQPGRQRTVGDVR
jgi:putative peptidoglycan lipid II flippase